MQKDKDRNEGQGTGEVRDVSSPLHPVTQSWDRRVISVDPSRIFTGTGPGWDSRGLN